MILVDAHVHIYDCFDIEKFFDSAYSNFQSAAKKFKADKDFTGILLLAETSKDNWFCNLTDYADGKGLPKSKKTGAWKFYHTHDNKSLYAKYNDSKSLIIVAGRQIITAEGIEVLAVGTLNRFKDGNSILNVLKEIEENDGVPIIPWGFGKWFGDRGRIVNNIIETYDSLIYLGDNGNRPSFWPKPTLLKLAKQRGIAVLPGSDPLPLSSEYYRAGSFGLSINFSMVDKKPASYLKNALFSSSLNFQAYGHLEGLLAFFRKQLSLRLRPRYSEIKKE